MWHRFKLRLTGRQVCVEPAQPRFRLAENRNIDASRRTSLSCNLQSRHNIYLPVYSHPSRIIFEGCKGLAPCAGFACAAGAASPWEHRAQHEPGAGAACPSRIPSPPPGFARWETVKPETHLVSGRFSTVRRAAARSAARTALAVPMRTGKRNAQPKPWTWRGFLIGRCLRIEALSVWFWLA